MTPYFLKERGFPPPLSLDLASVSTVNDFVTHIAFASKSFRRFVSTVRFLRQRDTRTLTRIMAIMEVEITMPLLVAVESVVWGGGIMMNVGTTAMLAEGDGDGSGITGIESCGVVIGVGKMVGASTVVVDGAMMRDVKGGKESVGPEEDVGFAPVSDERGCDEDATPDVASVEIGCPMVNVIIGVEGLKLTSNISDERPGL
jgi:hypothetical protein